MSCQRYKYSCFSQGTCRRLCDLQISTFLGLSRLVLLHHRCSTRVRPAFQGFQQNKYCFHQGITLPSRRFSSTWLYKKQITANLDCWLARGSKGRDDCGETHSECITCHDAVIRAEQFLSGSVLLRRHRHHAFTRVCISPLPAHTQETRKCNYDKSVRTLHTEGRDLTPRFGFLFRELERGRWFVAASLPECDTLTGVCAQWTG